MSIQAAAAELRPGLPLAPHAPVPSKDPSDAGPTENPRGGLGRAPELTLGMAFGTLLIAIGFAASRSQRSWASELYWAGQVTIYALPAGFLLFRRSLLRVEAVAIAFLMPISTYLVLLFYNPTRFLFLDEFSHVQTAQSILSTHHLFHISTTLAVSPQFPGLEIATTCVAHLTNLSIVASGFIVAGTAHVLVGLALYFLVSQLTHDHRIAALAAVIYATSPHYQFFDSYFIYETMALPFFLLVLLGMAKMLDEKGAAANTWAVVSIACGAAVAVSHHVTGFWLVGTLLVFCVAQLLLPKGVRTLRVPIVFVAVAATVIVWDLVVATSTLAYFKPVIQAFIGGKPYRPPRQIGATSVITGTLKRGPNGNARPVDSAIEYVSILILMALAPLGALKIWRDRRDGLRAVGLGLAISSMSIFVIVVLRLGAANGTVLAARSLTFIMIPISFVCAVMMGRSLANDGTRLPRVTNLARRMWTPLTKTAVIVVLALGGIAGGYPNYYSRLPGPYLVAAWERSIDSHNLTAASWVRTSLRSNAGLASDFFTAQTLSALGHKYNRKNTAGLFLTSQFTSADFEILRTSHVRYVVVDKRITTMLPNVGYYFAADPARRFYSKPLPRIAIDKFNSIPGVSRIYDDGTIIIYDFLGAERG
jgi:hypothetical protein